MPASSNNQNPLVQLTKEDIARIQFEQANKGNTHNRPKQVLTPPEDSMVQGMQAPTQLPLPEMPPPTLAEERRDIMPYLRNAEQNMLASLEGFRQEFGAVQAAIALLNNLVITEPDGTTRKVVRLEGILE